MDDEYDGEEGAAEGGEVGEPAEIEKSDEVDSFETKKIEIKPNKPLEAAAKKQKAESKNENFTWTQKFHQV